VEDPEFRTLPDAELPNVCEHFDVQWTSLERLMTTEGWSF